MKKHILFFFLVLNLLITSAWATEAFVVKKIQIDGLQRISAPTVYSYLPIKTGQTLRADKTADIIKALYKTGFFEHITLSRQGNTLVIHVVERATIGQLKISGNSVIATDKLTTVMRSVDVAEGRAYNRAVLDKIQQSLLNQYYQLGRYNARVDVSVTPQPRNRVLVKIDISEGLVAKIRRINIIGNRAFDEKTLDKQLSISTPGLFTIITQTDRFAQEKLDASLESLRNYYLDRGYIKFAIKSSQVSITPDRKSVYITVVIDEGARYRISGFALDGDLILPREQLLPVVKIKKGDIFSRQVVVDTEKAISDKLGDEGYIFTVVSLTPNINDATKEVFLTFTVKPGKRAYVRHIYFTDNAKTNDVVLRREMQQMESAPISTSKLETSTHRLKLLPYLKEVQMSIRPVPESDDLVDVNYKVTEDNTAQATFSLGYSQVQGPLIGAGVNQKNFMGTGKTLGVNFTRSRAEQFYGINYTNPYYTPDGISRSINLSISKFDASKANVSSSYTSNEYNAGMIYGIPIGQEKDVFNTLNLGYGYQETLVTLTNRVSSQVQNFTNSHGRHFQQLDLVAGVSRDSRDKAVFPTRGMIQTLNFDAFLPLTSHSLTYYTMAYDTKAYYPLVGPFIAVARGDVGYGNSFHKVSDFPFFKNYYAGGPAGSMGTVRGYGGNTLGPRDSRDNPSGGNFLATGTLGLVFPNYISDNLRTTLFVDGGNVWNTYDNRNVGGAASGPMRFSVGVQGDWLTPMGLIDVSLAKPLNRQHGGQLNSDDLETFQFSLGANFG